jgi:large subunit ribosomal protein L23
MKPILKEPVLTEKSTTLAKSGAYTFSVDGKASAPEIAKAVAKIYGVHPVSIRILKNPEKFRGLRSDRLVRRPIKKAIVTVKKGEKIAAFEVGEKK